MKVIFFIPMLIEAIAPAARESANVAPLLLAAQEMEKVQNERNEDQDSDTVFSSDCPLQHHLPIVRGSHVQSSALVFWTWLCRCPIILQWASIGPPTLSCLMA